MRIYETGDLLTERQRHTVHDEHLLRPANGSVQHFQLIMRCSELKFYQAGSQ